MTEVTRARPIEPPMKRNWLMAAVATARDNQLSLSCRYNDFQEWKICVPRSRFSATIGVNITSVPMLSPVP